MTKINTPFDIINQIRIINNMTVSYFSPMLTLPENKQGWFLLLS